MRHAAYMTALLACLLGLVRHAAAQDIRDIVITEFGIYTSKIQYKEPSDTATTGFINRVTDIKLIEPTDKLCARIGLSFGVYFLVNGASAGDVVDLQMVSRYPAPGVVDPNGRQHAISSYASKATVGGTGYRSFTFEYAWEMIAGEWALEFHHRGRKIAEQRFTVATACGIS